MWPAIVVVSAAFLTVVGGICTCKGSELTCGGTFDKQDLTGCPNAERATFETSDDSVCTICDHLDKLPARISVPSDRCACLQQCCHVIDECACTATSQEDPYYRGWRIFGYVVAGIVGVAATAAITGLVILSAYRKYDKWIHDREQARNQQQDRYQIYLQRNLGSPQPRRSIRQRRPPDYYRAG